MSSNVICKNCGKSFSYIPADSVCFECLISFIEENKQLIEHSSSEMILAPGSIYFESVKK